MNSANRADDPSLILARLDQIESYLQRLINLSSDSMGFEERREKVEAEWVDSATFCRIAGIRNQNSLSYFMSKGVFTNNAIRNVGTVKKPRYRFHRRKAVDEFLNRSQLQLP